MRRKAMFEKQVEQFNNQILRLEEQIIQLEASRTNAEVFQSIKSANHATQANLRTARIDDFDKIIDSVQETQEEIAEINEALTRPIGSAQQEDEDDLLAELDEMEAKDLDRDLLESGAPSVQKLDMEDDGILSPPAVLESADDETTELEELNAEIGI